VSILDQGVFRDCPLKEVGYDMDSHIKRISDFAFANCLLSSFSIPPECENIDRNAFLGCISIKKLNFLSDLGLTKACVNGFIMHSLASIEISGGAQRIPSDLFSRIKDNSLRKNWRLKDIALMTAPLMSIGSLAFFRQKEITRIEIPSTVIRIEDGAFHSCSRLEDLIIPEDSKLDFIGPTAFCACSRLSKLKLPPSIKYIGRSAFSNCSLLDEFVVHSYFSLEVIDDLAFSGCQLTRFTFPINSKKIGSGAFSACPLTYLHFCANSTMTSQILNGFNEFEITSISFDSEVNEIPEAAFQNWPNLVHISFEDIPITVIHASAFHQCPIRSITLPNSILTIEDKAFACSSLETLTIDRNSHLTTIGCLAFQGCQIQSLFLPEELENIDETAFEKCNLLTKVVFCSSSSTNIQCTRAFLRLQITEVLICSDHVTNISDEAFREWPILIGCKKSPDPPGLFHWILNHFLK
jgi:hypothetical protein